MPDVSDIVPQYDTKLFCQFWEGPEDFKDNYVPEGITLKPISDDNAKLLYCLLYAKYGNNPIASQNETQFLFKVYQVIFEYGPTWEKRLSIQKELRELTVDEMMKGSIQIYNHAYNPSTPFSSNDGEFHELPNINDQNVNKNKKGVLDAYSYLLDLLKSDVSEEFLNKFKPLFKTFVYPHRENIFVSEEEEEE